MTISSLWRYCHFFIKGWEKFTKKMVVILWETSEETGAKFVDFWKGM